MVAEPRFRRDVSRLRRRGRSRRHAGPQLPPILEGRTPADWRTAMYYRYYEFPGPHSVQKHYGVRTDRYKLIYFHDAERVGTVRLARGPGRTEERLRRSALRRAHGGPEAADGRAEEAVSRSRRRAGSATDRQAPREVEDQISWLQPPDRVRLRSLG